MLEDWLDVERAVRLEVVDVLLTTQQFVRIGLISEGEEGKVTHCDQSL